jgi:hypothetical protein
MERIWAMGMLFGIFGVVGVVLVIIGVVILLKNSG